MKKLMIGIPTYNRKSILELSATSFKEMKNVFDSYVVVYDDNSDEYNVDFLKKMYPMAKIFRNKKNIRASLNSLQMYKLFLNSDCDYFFNADSDLIFNQDLLKKIDEYTKLLEKSNKIIVISFFNTLKHKIIGNSSNNLILKKDVGAAGIVFNRAAVKMFYNDKINILFDNYFSNIFQEHNIPIYCTSQSYVQHIGYEGENSLNGLFDWGINFKIDSLSNANAIYYLIENNYINKSRIEIVYDNFKNGKMGLLVIFKSFIFWLKFKIKKIFRK